MNFLIYERVKNRIFLIENSELPYVKLNNKNIFLDVEKNCMENNTVFCEKLSHGSEFCVPRKEK